MSNKNPRDKRLLAAKKMPPLRRTVPGRTYSIEKDEAAAWMARQPELMNYLFDLLARVGYVIYDPESKTWRGTDHEN